jgi:hypothetical protein
MYLIQFTTLKLHIQHLKYQHIEVLHEDNFIILRTVTILDGGQG